MQGYGIKHGNTRPKMNFREATIEDFEIMADLSINQTVDRKMEEVVDYGYTLEHQGLILGMGGFRMVTKHTAWCWVNFSPYGVDRVRDSYRVIKEWIDKWAEFHKVSRLQAFCHDTGEYKRLVRHLGFEQESIMKNFYGNEDGLLFARTFKWD